jgi:hypothetical protein
LLHFKSAAVSIDEPDTVNWYGLQMGPSTFGFFDTFETEGRKAHLEGKIAEALMAEHYFLKIL